MNRKRIAPIMGINRLRMGTDGKGITALVAFYGCPLYCKYCINPQCHRGLSDVLYMQPKEVYDIVSADELYYLATSGGVTFGGGEPLLYSNYIIDVLELGAKKWNVTIETSLNVPFEQVDIVLPYVNQMIVDIKDINPTIYESYTHIGNAFVIENLKRLANYGYTNNIILRIPLINGYNTNSDILCSKLFLENLGYSFFDFFEYKTVFKI